MSQVQMENCSFETNNITPLKLTQTRLTVSGTLNFTNNTAYRGGGMVFFIFLSQRIVGCFFSVTELQIQEVQCTL